jgi:hypothetical protein
MDDGSVDREVEVARLREENAKLRQQAELNRLAHDYLVRLAHHFSGEEVEFEGPQEIRTFCERIRKSIGIMVGEFRELLKGRRQFQLEYNVLPTKAGRASVMQSTGGTKILRTGDLHGNLGKYLFYWRTREDPEEISDEEDLKIAIEELKHHQMALLSGFRKSLTDGTMTVLGHVSPDTIASHVHGDSASDDAKAGRTINPFRAARYWREFLRRFDDLASEDAAWFQRQFLPSFREGYREYMYKKTQAQSAQHSPSTEGER